MTTTLHEHRIARAHRRLHEWLLAYGARPHESTVTAVVYNGRTYAPREWHDQSKEG